MSSLLPSQLPTRRQAAGGLAAGVFGARLVLPRPAKAFAPSLQNDFAAIEAKSGGRLGVAVLDTATQTRFGHRADERFLLCNTFKVLAVSSGLNGAEAGSEG